MANKSHNLPQVQFCKSQFEDELSLINFQQPIVSQETPQWQEECFISPHNLSHNQIKFSQDSNQISKQLPFNICMYHLRQYEYVCCNCREMQCKLCQCLGFSDQSDTFKVPLRQRETMFSNSTNNQHRIVSLNKFLSLLKQQNKNMVDSKLHQYRIIQKNQKLGKTIIEFENKISEIQKQTQVCIEILKKNVQRCEQIIRRQLKNFAQNIKKQIQQQKKFVQYCQIMNKIMTTNQDNDAIELIIKNWNQISNKLHLGDTSKSTMIQFNNSSNLQKFRKSLDFIKYQNSDQTKKNLNSCLYANKILQNLKKIKDQSQKLFQNIQKNQNTLTKSLNSIEKSQKIQRKVVKQDMKISIFNLSSRLALNQVRINHKKQRLGNSITNLINRQIVKINKNSSKSQNNEVSNVLIYGGIHKSSLIQVYYPWQISKNKLTQNSKSIQEANDAPSHIGFGFAKLKDRSPNVVTNGYEFIIIGGFYSNQMSDCIFRVNCQKKKKEIVGRLTQPLAYFGFTSKIMKKDCGKNVFLVYLCGGLNNFKQPVSTFNSLQFSQTASLLNKNELPSLDQPRHSLSFAEHRSYFYATGGINGQNRVLKTVNKYCPKAKSWVHFPDLCYERSHHSAVSLRSGFYVIGGWNGQNYLRSVERLQQSRQSFHIVMDMKQSRCSFGLIGCTQSNGIIILGGKNISYLSSCQYLSIKNKSSCFLQPLKSPKSDFFCF